MVVDSPAERTPPPVEAVPEERARWADIEVGDDDISELFAAPVAPTAIPPTAAQPEPAHEAPASSARESEEEPEEAPIVLTPETIQLLASIPLEHDIIGKPAIERDYWCELRAQRAACLTQAASRASAETSTDEQIATYHDNAWPLTRHNVPYEDLWQSALMLVVTEGISFEKLSEMVLSRDERILPCLDEAVKGYFEVVAEGDPCPEWHFSRDPLFTQHSITQLFVKGAERRLSPSVETIVDHIMNHVGILFSGWNPDLDLLHATIHKWFRTLSR
jgi:hypothetical protein